MWPASILKSKLFLAFSRGCRRTAPLRRRNDLNFSFWDNWILVFHRRGSKCRRFFAFRGEINASRLLDVDRWANPALQQWGYQLIAPMRGSAFTPSESVSYGLEGAVDAAINKILTELREQRILTSTVKIATKWRPQGCRKLLSCRKV